MSERFRCGLLVERCRLRHLVVLAQEDRGRLPHAGEVHGGVEIRLGGGAVAENDQRHGVVAAQTARIPEPDGVRQMRSDSGVEACDPVAVHVPDVVVVGNAQPETHGAAQVHVATDPQRQLAVGGEDPIGGAQRQRSPGGCLLTARLVVGRDATLALQVQQLLVHDSRCEHLAQQIDKLIVTEIGCDIDEFAVGVENLMHAHSFTSAVSRASASVTHSECESQGNHRFDE